MCRGPIYFKGFHKVRDSWDEDSYDIKCSEILNSIIDSHIDDAIELADTYHVRYRAFILNIAVEKIKMTEKMFRFLKSDMLSVDDIDYILNETAIYLSDRNMNKFTWLDEPIKDCATQYPRLQKAKASRCRETQGSAEWEMIVTFWTV